MNSLLRTYSLFIFVAVALILVACTATPIAQAPSSTATSLPQEPTLVSTSVQQEPSPTPSQISQQPASATTPAPQDSAQTPNSLPTILPTPASVASFDDRLLAKIDIGYPDELVFAQNFVWVKTDDGHLMQTDPATNRVVGDIKVDTTTDRSNYCQGLSTDGEAIWACSASEDEDHKTIDVVRIDPKSQSVVATVKVNKIFDQFDMPFLLNQIWVLSDNGRKLIGIDTTTNQPTSSIDLGTRCFQVAVMGKTLLVTCALDNLVLRIDPEKMAVTDRLPFTSPRNIVTTEDGVWLVQDGAIIRLDPESLAPVATFTGLLGIGTSGDIFVTNEAVWVRQESGFVYRIDPASNQITEQIKPDQGLSGGSILATSDSIWTTANDDDLLLRLSLH